MKHSKYYELNSEEATKAYLKAYWRRHYSFYAVALCIFAAEVMISRSGFVLVAMPIMLVLIIGVFLWFLIKWARINFELDKVLTTDCDPRKYIEVMERLSKHWNFKRSLKNISGRLMAAYIYEEDYDIAEMRANEALGRSRNEKYKLTIKSCLGRIYYSTDRYDKFLEINKQIKEAVEIVKLNKTAKALFEEEFLRQDAMIAYKEGRFEDAKRIMEDVVTGRRVDLLISNVIDSMLLGDINYELGEYIEAAAKYVFVTENGNKLKMVKKAQERVEEIKKRTGETE
jgi:hypothetical protein